jgi:hypothetical protein
LASLTNFAATVAGSASDWRGTWFSSAAVTVTADLITGDLNLFFYAKYRLFKVEIHAVLEVSAAPGDITRPT